MMTFIHKHQSDYNEHEEDEEDDCDAYSYAKSVIKHSSGRSSNNRTNIHLNGCHDYRPILPSLLLNFMSDGDKRRFRITTIFV